MLLFICKYYSSFYIYNWKRVLKSYFLIKMHYLHAKILRKFSRYSRYIAFLADLNSLTSCSQLIVLNCLSFLQTNPNLASCALYVSSDEIIEISIKENRMIIIDSWDYFHKFNTDWNYQISLQFLFNNNDFNLLESHVALKLSKINRC